MDNQEVLKYLLRTNELEEKALRFIEHNGKRPSVIDFLYIFMDEDYLEHIRVNEYNNSKINGEQLSRIVYHEKDCFLSGTNIELNKTGPVYRTDRSYSRLL